MRRTFSRIVTGATVLLASYVAGCSSDSTPATPVCDGVSKNGVCYALCDETLDCKSAAKQVCTRSDATDPGACHTTCAAAADCAEGQACAPATTVKGAATTVCAPRTPAGTKGSACTAPTDCDTDHGLVCSAGTCVGASGHGCVTSADCDVKGGSVCIAGTCKTPGKSGDACKAAAECASGLVCSGGKCAMPGMSGTLCKAKADCVDGLDCVGGTCGTSCASVAQDACPPGFQCKVPASGAGGVCLPQPVDNGPGQYGTSCPHGDSDCDSAAGFTCLGVVGDIDAYCAKLDGCKADGDCPSGMWCAEEQQVDASGNVLIGQAKRVCQPRGFCAPCAGDLDCALHPGQICVPDANGEKYCALPCDPTAYSCILGAHCTDVGGGINACRPTAGACHAKTPTACSPCRGDSDCGPGGVCRDGSVYGITGLSWCATPCGPPDAYGKATCPKAINGEETVCFDKNIFSYGDETFDGSSVTFRPQNQGHCVAPWVTQNLPLYQDYDPKTMLSGPQHDPPANVCGNGRRELDEECDDGFGDGSAGCAADCKVIPECRFVAGADNSDTNTALVDSTGATVAKVPTKCHTFLVTGDIDKPGVVRSFLADIESGGEAYVDVFTDKVGQCNFDLQAEAREGLIDLTTPCNKLVSGIYSAETATALCTNKHLSCGPCTPKGVCGTCDDDGGPGACPRFVASTALYFYQYTVDNTSVQKTFRVYAHDPTKSGAHFLFLVSRGYVSMGHKFGGEDSPAYPPAPSCW
jgi:hypothetical protein